MIMTAFVTYYLYRSLYPGESSRDITWQEFRTTFFDKGLGPQAHSHQPQPSQSRATPSSGGAKIPRVARGTTQFLLLFLNRLGRSI